MKVSIQRSTFTMLMTVLATLFGTVYGAYELRGHSDILADLVKISALLAIVSVCTSYTFWTLTHLSKDSVFRGGLAGLLTGLAIVPVPYFTSTLKAEAFRLHDLGNGGFFISILEAIPLSVIRGLETFQIISKVSLVAVMSSVVLGIYIAKNIPPQVIKTPLNSK